MIITVGAAVIQEDGRVLLASRGDQWEFPGGKCEPDEPVARCIEREIREELGIEVWVLDEMFRFSRDTDGKTLELRFHRCIRRNAKIPTGCEGQSLRWSSFDELAVLPILEPDRPLTEFLAKKSAVHTIFNPTVSL